MNYNKIILIGRLTQNAEIRYSAKGVAVTNISIAINRKWKAEDGSDREEATFVDVKSFGKTAEVIGKYFGRGDPILVEGRLATDSWTDKDQQPRSKLVVVCERFEFVGGRKDQAPAEPKPKTNMQKDMENPESPVPF